MATKVIDNFLPDLVTAISDCVQPVSDQCLAKGLIPDSVYKRVLESEGTSEDKARTLEILLDILETQLPFSVKKKLLSDIRHELPENVNIADTVPLEELPKESSLLQDSVIGKFEDAIRQHERACAERSMLEEKLKAKTKEYDGLKREFEATNSQLQAESQAANTQTRIANSKRDIEDLREGIRKLEHTIEEQGMRVKRGRVTMVLTSAKVVAGVTTTWKEMRKTKQELTQTIHENKLRIKELELETKQHDALSFTQPLDIFRAHHATLIKTWLEKGSRNKSPFWRNLGLQLGFTTEELDRIEQHKAKDKLHQLLVQWTRWYPRDSRGSTNFATYTGLQKALIRAGLEELILWLPYYETFTKL